MTHTSSPQRSFNNRRVQRQRQVYKNTFVTPKARKSFGQMTEEQKQKLEALQFNFEIPEELRGPPPVDWNEAFAALKAYKAKNGDTNVPEGTLFGKGFAFTMK